MRRNWKAWVIALCGLWEFGDIAAPFVIGFDNVRPAVWNHIGVGLVLMIAGISAARAQQPGAARRWSWIAAAAGAWLVVASFLLRSLVMPVGLLNDVVVGMITVVLGAWAALQARRADG